MNTSNKDNHITTKTQNGYGNMFNIHYHICVPKLRLPASIHLYLWRKKTHKVPLFKVDALYMSFILLTNVCACLICNNEFAFYLCKF